MSGICFLQRQDLPWVSTKVFWHVACRVPRCLSTVVDCTCHLWRRGYPVELMQFCHCSHSSKIVDPKCLPCFELRKNCDLALKVTGFSCPMQLNSHRREKAGEGEDRRVIQSGCPPRRCLATSAMRCSSGRQWVLNHYSTSRARRLWPRAIAEFLQSSPDGESLPQLCILWERTREKKERAVWSNGAHVPLQRLAGHLPS